MSSSNYIQELKNKLEAKKKQLEELYKKRELYAHNKENFWNVQSGINSTATDIEIIKSRIANYGKDVYLPDHSNVNTINNHIK